MSNKDEEQQFAKAATAFTIAAAEASAYNSNSNGSAVETGPDDSGGSEALLPDRLRRRLQAERKCRPTNEQLDQKLARAEQRRQKQVAKRAANAREADARCRRVAEAMEALHARRPGSRDQVMQRFVQLQHDLQGVLGRFNSEVERTNCALFADAPLLAFGCAQQQAAPPTSTMTTAAAAAAATTTTTSASGTSHKRRNTAFDVANPVAAADAASDMPARLKQRLAAYPKRRDRHELKMALDQKLADAQRRKERYERRRAESIKDTEERCRRISETLEEISLVEDSSDAAGGAKQRQQSSKSTCSMTKKRRQQAAVLALAEAAEPSSYYGRVARLQVDLDCLFTKFNREFVTVRGRPIDLMAALAPLKSRSSGASASSSSSVACQTEAQCCTGCGRDPNA